MKIKLNVQRADESGNKGYSKYEIEGPESTTLLDALIQV